MVTMESRTIVTFGTFEVDFDSGELRKSGLRIKLQGQPFRVLKTLLSQAGEIVTREELQQQIWGVNTTIDFERGIAGAINKIREALGDSADSPRYVETLARRGFRFIAPVRLELLPPKPSGLTGSAAHLSATHATEEGLSPPGETSPRQPGPAHPVTGASVGEATVPPVPYGLPITPPFPPLLSVWVRLRNSWSLAGGTSLALLLFGVSGWLLAYLQVRASTPNRPPRIEQLTQSGTIYSGPPNAENFLSMVTDGTHLYTTVETAGRLQVSSIDLSGTTIKPIDMPDDLQSISIADISRDGSKLLIRSRPSRDSEQPLWIVPTSGSTALRLGEIVAHDATWMPDGDSVLFASGNELRTVQLASGVVHTYATLPGRAFWPRWSPDGSTLRFTLLDPITHDSSLWETTAKSAHPRRLEYPQLASLSLCCGSWTSDGAAYALQASNYAGSNIWLIKDKGHQLTELTNGPLRFLSPLPGRDSNQLYFIGLEQPAGTRFYDEALREFVPSPPYLAQARRVSYSRDGKWVAWTDTSGRLWRARSADGSAQLQLSEEDLEVFLAQWAPDGRQLVMMARKPGETWKLYTVNSMGGVPHPILSDHSNLADPDWSADGRSIVFGREADLMGKESGPHNIQVLNLETHQLRVLPNSDDLFSPRWSPDGRWIAALSRDQNSLRLFDTEHQTWTTLFSGGAADPVWGSDSRAIYFHAFETRNSAIMRVEPSGEKRIVTDLSQVNLPSVNNYFFGGITPSSAPIIEPRVGTGNLYSIDLSTPRH